MAKQGEPVASVNDISRISSLTSVRGDISSNTDVRIDGKVEGTLYSTGRIVVGPQASIKGAVLCENLDLRGRVDGDVYVKDTLSLKDSSVVDGSIHVRRLGVEIGAQINGSCSMITEEEFDKYVSTVVKNTL